MKKLIVLALALVLTAAFAGLSFAAPKDYEFAGGDQGKVTFSHAKHLEKLNNKCAECHPKVFQMKKGGADKPFTMADMKEGKNCGACHNGKVAFDAQSKDNCGKCHKK